MATHEGKRKYQKISKIPLVQQNLERKKKQRSKILLDTEITLLY